MQENEVTRQIAAVFNQVASGYDREALRFFPFVADALIARLGPVRGQKILDVAAGTGAVTIGAAHAVGPQGRVIAIDMAEDMLDRLQIKIARYEFEHVDIHVMDAQSLEFRRDYFDHVVCSFGLFFLPDMQASVREWARVTKPGGTVRFTSFGPQAFRPLLDLFCEQISAHKAQMPEVLALHRLTERQQCEDLLRNAGLQEVRIETQQLGYHLGNAAEWWDIVWNSGFRGLIEQLAPDAQVQLKREHLREIAARLATPQGIWLDVETLFACGRKA